MAVSSSDRDLDALARTLPSHAGRLTRLLLRLAADADVPRSMAGVLAALAERPRRITELAEWEGLAQPTTTQLVRQMEDRGWVARRPDPEDRRAVLVTITDDGRRARERLLDELAGVLAERTADYDDDAFAALVAADRALADLLDALAEPRRARPTTRKEPAA